MIGFEYAVRTPERTYTYAITTVCSNLLRMKSSVNKELVAKANLTLTLRSRFGAHAIKLPETKNPCTAFLTAI